MDANFDLADPAEFAAAAGNVLRAAWSPPCLHYSTDYVAWQLSFPGATPPQLAMALSKGRAIGCIGVTPRTFRWVGETIAAYVLSFVAVDPKMRGQGVAARLYETILGSLPSDVPIIAFSQPGTVGERRLLNAFKASHHCQLQDCRAVGYAPSGATPLEDGRYLVEQVPADGFVVFADDGSSMLWHAPADDQVRHYACDPRKRIVFVIRHIDNGPVAAAMAVATEVTTAEGRQTVATLENLSMAAPSSVLLQTALGAAAHLLGSTNVIAPNLGGVSPEIAKSARARSLPSVFNAHLFRWPYRSVPSATNLEVT